MKKTTRNGFNFTNVHECGVCSRYFSSENTFYRCWICFKKDRGYSLTKGDQVLDEQITALDKIYRKYLILEDQPPQKVVHRTITLDTLATKRLRKLLKLCHPDRHTSKMQESATDITSWLLAINSHSKKK